MLTDSLKNIFSQEDYEGWAYENRVKFYLEKNEDKYKNKIKVPINYNKNKNSFRIEELDKCIKNLKNKKAPGPDTINNKTIKTSTKTLKL